MGDVWQASVPPGEYRVRVSPLVDDTLATTETDLSVTPVSIPGLKDHIATVDAARARGLAQRALEASEPAEVERIFGGEP